MDPPSARDEFLLSVLLENSELGIPRFFHAVVTAFTSDDGAKAFFLPSSGGVDIRFLMDLTGLGVLAIHSSTGYAGWGRYAVDEKESLSCGIDGSGLDESCGGSNLKAGGTESR